MIENKKYSVIPRAAKPEKENFNIVEAFRLLQNYPNPFNPTTSIEYFVPERSQVRLSVYNLLGEKINVLFAGIQNPGKQTATWDGRDAEGKLVGSGVYVYKLEAGSVQLSREMMFLGSHIMLID